MLRELVYICISNADKAFGCPGTYVPPDNNRAAVGDVRLENHRESLHITCLIGAQALCAAGETGPHQP